MGYAVTIPTVSYVILFYTRANNSGHDLVMYTPNVSMKI
jgi:hypothetical protein